MTDEDEIREWVARLTSRITEPFGELIINELNNSEPRLEWFGDLDQLMDHIAKNPKRIGMD
ncbi:MAG: hypothetical protein AB3N21_13790 [Ruegeria sp.]|uniref:hypothetical protein n=1 Tax=Ruegeria sp. TaxID=1879320 RepID=UPI00349EAABE